MKRISRSLLSLCLALVLCAALLPVNDAKATGGGTTARTGTSFLITGYRASRKVPHTPNVIGYSTIPQSAFNQIITRIIISIVF